MKREITLFPELATAIDEFRQHVEDVWYNISQDNIRHLYDRLLARIHTCVAKRVGTLCIDLTDSAPLTVTRVFHLF